jgi:hypothetical protein
VSVHGAIFEAPAAHGSGDPTGGAWGEGDPFLTGLSGRFMPFARALAPIAAQAVAGMLPREPVIDHQDPLGARLDKAEQHAAFVKAASGNLETWAPEASRFDASDGLGAADGLAIHAAHAPSDVEAATILTGTLPITISVMGGRRTLRPVLPTLAQATSRLVGALGRQGSPGRALLRAVPAIHRRTVALLRAANLKGHPISGELATQAMARATSSVLTDARLLREVLAAPGPETENGGCSCGPRIGPHA